MNICTELTVDTQASSFGSSVSVKFFLALTSLFCFLCNYFIMNIHNYILHAAGDVLEDLSTPLLDITNKKLGNPSLQCCMLHSIEECERERVEEARKKQAEARSEMGGFNMGRWQGAPQLNNSQRRNENVTNVVLVTLMFLSMFW